MKSMSSAEEGRQGTVAARYKQLQSSRTAYLERGYSNAQLTIPALLPRHRGSSQNLDQPSQSIGAHGVNNLGSKILLAILPPNSPFFRQRPTPSVQRELDEAGDEEGATKIEEALSERERETMASIEASGDRVVIHEMALHLLVTGNVLLNVAKDGSRLFHLDRFVVKRNPEGHPLEIIAHEEVTPDALPETIRDRVQEGLANTGSEYKTVDLYTQIRLDGEFHRVHQEVNGLAVPESHGTYRAEQSPWIPLRFTRVDGEDYGRAFIDGLYGDLHSAEFLTKAMVDGALAASKVIFLVRPNGTTQIKVLEDTDSGDIREGNAADVSTLQVEKFADFRVALEQLDRIEARLARAFLMNSSVQRDAERVTREEIRFMAQELEAGLGGFYSILSMEFQLPYVRRRLSMLPKGKRLPKDLVTTSIVTGLEALGRGNDLDKLDLLLQGAAQTLGPEVVGGEINGRNYLDRRAAALGIDTEGLFKSPEQKATEAQQNQMMQMIQTLGPEALKQFGGQLPNLGAEQDAIEDE